MNNFTQKCRDRRTVSPLYQKMLMLLLLMVVGVSGAWGIGLSKEIALPADATNGQGSWDKNSQILSWTEAYNNVINVTDAQDLSDYKGITVDSQDLTAGATFRIILNSGGNSYQYVMNTAGVHQILFSDFKIDNTDTAISSAELENATIQIAGRYGGEGTRSVKINRLGLIKVKWWNDRQATITPDELTTFGTSKSENDFTYSIDWHEVRIFLDGSDANEIGSVIVNTNSGDWYTLGYMSDKGWCASLDDAKAKNAKLTEVRIYAKQLGTYNISSVVFTQPYEVHYWASDAVVPDNCDWWYTVGDDETKIKETRKFAPGTKITFHASDANSSTYVFNGWYKKDVPTSAFFYYGGNDWVAAPSLDADLNYLPEWQASHTYKAMVSGEGGTAIVYAKGDGNKVNINGNKYQNWLMKDGVVFEAIPTNDRYTFYKWSEGGTANPLEFSEHADATVYTRTAIFKKSIGKPECNHYGDRTDGDNYFDIRQLNVGDGVTIADASIGRDVTVPTTGGYMSYVFDNTYNLSDLSAWTISGNEELQARVNSVEFIGGDNGTSSLDILYTDAGNRGESNNKAAIAQTTKDKLTKVKEIRIHFKASTEQEPITEAKTYNFEWIRFSFTHADHSVTPQLTNGTATEMEADINSRFALSADKGYWREYESDFSAEKSSGMISGKSSTHTFESGLAAGDYYFGIQDNEDCALGYNHHSDVVQVHVRVANLQPSVTCENGELNLSHVKAFGNITSNYADGKITADITANSNEYGNGFEIEFLGVQDFSRVKTIKINTNFDFTSGTDVYLEDAERPNDNGDGKKAYWPWGNTYSDGTFTMNLNSSSSFDKIKKLVLRTHNNIKSDFELTSIAIEYDHTLPTPQFIDGTEASMVITEGETLKLSVDDSHNTYWREYKDENFNWYEQIGDRIPTNEWNTPVREIPGLLAGKYYFAAERAETCEFGKWHTSGKNMVVVTVKETTNSTDFAGYYRFNNRLAAQWNFDQCDGFRFNTAKIGSGNEYWTGGETDSDGNKVYTYKKAIGNVKPDGTTAEVFYSNEANFAELTYDGSANNKLAITSGLKFNAPANSIKLVVSYTTIDGHKVAQGARLQVTNEVKMLVPYVENTFRNDMGSDMQPFETKDEEGNITASNRAEYANSVHHWKRDILYVSLKEGSVWGSQEFPGHILNKCIDDDTKDLFNGGGEETVNGIFWYKMNYMGNYGTPCVLQFGRPTTTFNRLAVNRNLTYSFYSEYINDFGAEYVKPRPRVRVIGSPSGAQVANLGPFLTYNDAIAFTYGGWKSSAEDDDEDRYNYTSYEEEVISDQWGDLGVYTGSEKGFLTWNQMGSGNAPTASNTVPVASDGFPVLSMNNVKATSGGLMPASLTEDSDVRTVNGKELPNYHPKNDGKLYVGAGYPYKANITPWSLPSRGAYLKFEPSYPGVLNVHIFQQPNKIYYIADEFGVPQSATDVFTKTASNTNSVNKVTPEGVTDNEHGVGFSMTGTEPDYVKYSFNVYPGKTYYMFSNEVGMGFAGFYYEPFVERKNVNDEFGRLDVQVDEVSLDKATDYTFPTLPKASTNKGKVTLQSPKKGGGYEGFDIHYSKSAVKVSLNRSFTAGQWNSICLPYSMNQVQMEQVFGAGTRVVLLRDLQNAEHSDNNKITLNLVCHENQDIIAGYPYFILPTKSITNVETYACLDKFPAQSGGIPTIVSIDSKGPNTYSYVDKDYNGLSEYTFKGTFSNTTVKKGSWYVGGGVLKKLTADQITLNPYRAWLELKEGVSPTWAKKLGAVRGIDADLEEETTSISIDELLENSGIFTQKSNVYSVDGKLVRANAENLNGLPKGIYIVNGKKYIVK